MSAHRQSRFTVWPILLVLAAAILPYLNTGRTVLFLDSLMLDSIPEAKDVALAFERLIVTAVYPGQELTILTIAINHRINLALGLDGFHAPSFVFVNVGLHAIHAVLVYYLLRSLLGRLRPTRNGPPFVLVAAAMLYASHPIHVSSVIDAIQRRSILAGLFQTAAMLAYLRCRDEKDTGNRARWIIATLAFLWLGMKSRSTGLAAPLVLVTLEIVLQLAEGRSLRRMLPRVTVPILMCAALAFMFAWKMELLNVTSLSMRSPQTMNVEADWGGRQQAMFQAQAYATYGSLLFFPSPRRLCIDHAASLKLGTPDKSNVGKWFVGGVHLIIIATAVFAAHSGLAVGAFGILLFYATQLLWLLLPHPGQVVEYRLYAAAIATSLVVLELIMQIPREGYRNVAAALCIIATMFLATITWQRNEIFQSPVTIWQDVVDKYPGQFRSEYNLANALFRDGHYEKAVQHYRNACAADFLDHRPHYNLANTLFKLGMRDEAAREYGETLHRKPDHAGAKQGLADCKLQP
ncbi:MAG: tetratricopeptide repeat protein [Planctomycetes bacterium]|nr:tetratricopeptide repeat protein [Planctomycetota bacterium]